MKLPSYIFLCLFFFLAVFSCTNNDAQQDFERKALSQAEGITQTDNSANIIGEPDEDDWQTSPFYTGIVNVEPASPNPLLYGTRSTIEIVLSGNSLTTSLELGYFDFRNIDRNWQRLDTEEDLSDYHTAVLSINSELFGSNADLARGLYRIVVFDGSNRVVTYGDIEIE